MLNKDVNRKRRAGFLATSSLISVAILLIIAFPLAAQTRDSGGKSPSEWQFTLAPYLLVPWMHGSAGVMGVDVDVDVTPRQILDNLQFGAMGYFEARNDKWAIGVDAVYMALGTTVERAPILGTRANADVDFNQGAYTFTGMRKLNEKVDFLAGARWNVLKSRIGFKGPSQTTLEQTQQWVDPIVGLKLRHRISERCQFSMQGDIGGFGAGSDFSWQLFPVVGAEVSQHFTLAFGYRVLGMDYTNGSNERRFKYDVITHGVVIGGVFHF